MVVISGTSRTNKFIFIVFLLSILFKNKPHCCEGPFSVKFPEILLLKMTCKQFIIADTENEKCSSRTPSSADFSLSTVREAGACFEDGRQTTTQLGRFLPFHQTVTQREILERNGIINICSWHGAHLKHMFFWHVFGSMGFLQLKEEKFCDLKIFQSRYLFLSRQSKRNQNSYFT